MPRHLKRIGGIWHYFRRVPRRFADIDRRTFVKLSLETRDLNEAERKKPAIERAVEERWTALKKGGADDADEAYAGAVELARLVRFPYRTARQLAEGPFEDLIRRVQRLERMGVMDATATAALLGGREAPTLTVTAAWHKFLELTRDRQRRYSADQLRRWKAPRLKAVGNFVKAVADKPLAAIDRDDALAFRAWWLDRVEAGGVTPQSANKDIGHLRQIFRTVSDGLELGLGDVLKGLHLAEDDEERGKPIPTDWIRHVMLAPGKLDGLNAEARGILLAMIETGLRPSEICGLLPDDIRLEHDVPHVKIVGGPGRRRLKTPYSERDMPLVGVSLKAIADNPGGFPRYREKPAQLSAAVNKFLGENGLLPSRDHSLYSLRHSFSDRLNAAEANDRVHADLMGHKFERPKYGEGLTLAHKRDWLIRIAVSVTSPGP
jgi:integrase